MKKCATSLVIIMVLASFRVFSQSRTETTVKLEWQEQGFIHFYTSGYSVYISKPEFLDFSNELLAGLFDEFAQKQDSIDLKDPFPVFKTEQQDILWDQLIQCASEGHMLILPNDSKKKLKNVLIIDDSKVYGSSVKIWECRDPKTNRVIFDHNQKVHVAPAF